MTIHFFGARRARVLAGVAAAVLLASCGQPSADRADNGVTGSIGASAGNTAVASTSGGLADGAYDCGNGQTAMGDIDIKGDQFRYRPYGEAHNGFAPYSVDGDGHITWGAPFGGLDDPPARITGSQKESWGFNVMYQVTPDSYIDTMSCHRM